MIKYLISGLNRYWNIECLIIDSGGGPSFLCYTESITSLHAARMLIRVGTVLQEGNPCEDSVFGRVSVKFSFWQALNFYTYICIIIENNQENRRDTL